MTPTARVCPLARLAAYEFPVELNEVTRAYFARSAEVESDPKLAADMRAVAKATPDLAAAARLSASLPYYNAMMRTTCVATKLLGGHATNALPQMASANVNCRILPGVSPASVKAKLIEVLADPKIAVAFVDEAHPSKPSPLRPDVMTLVESLTKQRGGGIHFLTSHRTNSPRHCGSDPVPRASLLQPQRRMLFLHPQCTAQRHPNHASRVKDHKEVFGVLWMKGLAIEFPSSLLDMLDRHCPSPMTFATMAARDATLSLTNIRRR